MQTSESSLHRPGAHCGAQYWSLLYTKQVSNAPQALVHDVATVSACALELSRTRAIALSRHILILWILCDALGSKRPNWWKEMAIAEYIKRLIFTGQSTWDRPHWTLVSSSFACMRRRGETPPKTTALFSASHGRSQRLRLAFLVIQMQQFVCCLQGFSVDAEWLIRGI